MRGLGWGAYNGIGGTRLRRNEVSWRRKFRIEVGEKAHAKETTVVSKKTVLLISMVVFTLMISSCVNTMCVWVPPVRNDTAADEKCQERIFSTWNSSPGFVVLH